MLLLEEGRLVMPTSSLHLTGCGRSHVPPLGRHWPTASAPRAMPDCCDWHANGSAAALHLEAGGKAVA